MRQDPHVSKRVHVVCGVDCQGASIAFGVVIGNEGVGGTAVAEGISIGLWATKGDDTTVLEGGLEGESVLEGLDLTKSRVFGRSNSGSATVIDLLSDIRRLPGQTTKDRLEIGNGNMLGSVETQAINPQTQDFIGMISELAADVVSFCSQVGEVGKLAVLDLPSIVP